jgi:hypothetical protein
MFSVWIRDRSRQISGRVTVIGYATMLAAALSATAAIGVSQPDPYGLPCRQPVQPYLHLPPQPAKATLPPLLSATGVFRQVATLTPAEGLIPYTIHARVRSDSAVPSRWIALPCQAAMSDGDRVQLTASGEWSFPAGTVFVQHLELPVDARDPRVRRRLETRLLVRNPEGSVYGVTYKWRPDNSDADLVDDGTSEPITIRTTAGMRTQVWHYPGRQECLTCHNASAHYVLGVNARQLNSDWVYPSTGVRDNQLRTWNHLGLFEPPLAEEDVAQYRTQLPLGEASASLTPQRPR